MARHLNAAEHQKLRDEFDRLTDAYLVLLFEVDRLRAGNAALRATVKELQEAVTGRDQKRRELLSVVHLSSLTERLQ